MPAGVENFAANSETKDSFDFGKDSPAFTIVSGANAKTTTLPMLDITNGDGESDAEERKDSRTSVTAQNSTKDGSCVARKRMSRSNDHLVLASLQNHQSNPLRRKERSKSHDNLGERVDGGMRVGDKSENRNAAMTLSTEDFNQVLNAKLRKIQQRRDDEDGRKRWWRSSSGSGRNQQVFARKPFITTVKSGEFLMPPPEVAAILGTGPPNGSSIAPNLTDPIDQSNRENNGIDGPFPRSKFRPLVSLGRRPEVRRSSHDSRCQAAALKATIDFTASLVNCNRNSCVYQAPSVATNASKFVNAETHHQPLPFGNIMFDRRVVRGSTFASAPMLIDASEQSHAARLAEAKRKEMGKKRHRIQASRSTAMMMMRIDSPPPVHGRKHEPVQTEVHLEELFDKPDEFEVGTQTDYFLDGPATPIHCPGRVGQDAQTQIAPGDLFDYDAEVQPILRVLVGRTIEQALVEVVEEEELAALREQQRRFLELRNAEKAEQQRLEEQERRLRDEKCRRVKQREEATRAHEETQERVAAAVLLTACIAELLPAVLESLKISGILLDEIKSDVEGGFVPWLMNQVKREMGSMIESRELLMEIIREILENRALTYSRLAREYDESRVNSGSDETPAASHREICAPTEEGAEAARDADFIDYVPLAPRSARR